MDSERLRAVGEEMKAAAAEYKATITFGDVYQWTAWRLADEGARHILDAALHLDAHDYYEVNPRRG